MPKKRVIIIAALIVLAAILSIVAVKYFKKSNLPIGNAPSRPQNQQER